MGFKSAVQTIIRWGLGLFLSLLAIWAVTAIFTENRVPRTWNEALSRNVPKPGWVFQNIKEARAQTEFGELGLKGTRKVADSGVPKILIWGDSFVAALQVDEEKRMHRQLERIMTDDNNLNFQVIGIGQRFQSVADYIFQIPIYEPIIKPTQLHVIHVHSLEDFYPDKKPEDRISRFLSKPELHFERYDNEYGEIETPEVNNPIKELAFRARTQFFLRTRNQLMEIARLKGLRFSPSTQSAVPKANAANTGGNRLNKFLNPEWVSRAAPIEAWDFAIKSLTEVTDVPIVIVYAPATPTLGYGKIVRENPEAELVEVFADICRQKSVGFISLEKNFLHYHDETGKFPKGFQTSRPWGGHYNAEGHRIVAEAIYQWIKENPDVIHSN